MYPVLFGYLKSKNPLRFTVSGFQSFSVKRALNSISKASSATFGCEYACNDV